MAASARKTPPANLLASYLNTLMSERRNRSTFESSLSVSSLINFSVVCHRSYARNSTKHFFPSADKRVFLRLSLPQGRMADQVDRHRTCPFYILAQAPAPVFRKYGVASRCGVQPQHPSATTDTGGRPHSCAPNPWGLFFRLKDLHDICNLSQCLEVSSYLIVTLTITTNGRHQK